MNNKYLTKIAKLSEDAKKEIAQTGVLAAVGGATGIGADAIMKTRSVSNWKVPSAVKAGFLVGGLGLLGDIAAVKVNRKIEKRAGVGERLIRLIKRTKPQTLEQRKTIEGHKKYYDGMKPPAGPTDHKKRK